MKRIDKLISEDNLQEAFDQLLEVMKNDSSFNSLRKELLIRSGQLKKIESEKRTGIINDQDYFKYRNTIAHVILQVAFEIEGVKKVKETIERPKAELENLVSEVKRLQARIKKLEYLLPSLEQDLGIKNDHISLEERIYRIEKELSTTKSKKNINTYIRDYKHDIRLKESNINYVLLIGASGVGKSTLLANINRSLLNHEKYSIRYLAESQSKSSYIFDLLTSSSSNTSNMTRELIENEEITLSIEDDKNNFVIPITFIVTDFDYDRNDAMFPDIIHPIIKKKEFKDINLQILFVTSTKRGNKDDFIHFFLREYFSEYLQHKSSMSMVVTKSDLTKDKSNLKNEIALNFPNAINYYKNQYPKSQIYTFSAIDDNEEKSKLILEGLIKKFRTTPSSIPPIINSILQILGF